MVTKDKKILVTGATGKQGGAVAHHLLDAGFQVLALTRDASKPRAQELERRGAQLVQGDLDDMDSIRPALNGVYGVFSVQNFWETGPEREIKQGKDLADAARDAGVKHFVYSSVGSADQQTGLSHFESKWEIEKHIRDIGLRCTTIRPVFFMENFRSYVGEPILNGVLPQPLDPDVPLQMIAVDDIGGFAAIVFEHPEEWIGKAVDLAGDAKTMPEVAEIFTQILGYRVEYMQVPWDKFSEQAGEESTQMYRWFNEVGYHADIEALRAEYPALQTLEQVLRKENWPVKTVV